MMSFEITVVYALPDRLIQEAYEVQNKTTIKDVLLQFCGTHGELKLQPDQLIFGIYSEKKQLHDTMQPGDRVEIYRELTQDPKMRRRNKVPK